MSVNYSCGLSPYSNKGKCGMPEKQDDYHEQFAKAHKLVKLIQSSKMVIIHTGAGISTSSGIPDFRGPNGVWTLEEKGLSPKCNVTFDQAAPTFAHRCLVMMEQLGIIDFIVSQNVDGLHVRSGFPRNRLAELHGNMFVQKCQLCGRSQVMNSVSPTMGLRLTGKKCEFQKSKGTCRGVLRDTILDWEDALPAEDLALAETFCKAADLSIVMGSSLQIQPAGNLPLLTKRNGGKLVIINLQRTKQDKRADLRIYGYIDEIMKLVADELGLAVPAYGGPAVCEQSKRQLPDFKSLKKQNQTRNRKRKHSPPEGNVFPKNKESDEKSETAVVAKTNTKNQDTSLVKPNECAQSHSEHFIKSESKPNEIVLDNLCR